MRRSEIYYPNLAAFVERFVANVFCYHQSASVNMQWVSDWWRYPALVFPLDAMWRAYENARKAPGQMMIFYIQAASMLDRVFDKDRGIVASPRLQAESHQEGRTAALRTAEEGMARTDPANVVGPRRRRQGKQRKPPSRQQGGETMAQSDPEDGFDQIMVQSWNSVAQQLRTLHNELSGDRARRRERAERAVQNERYEQTRRQQQSIRLEQWEMDNRERLNKGFESTLNATVLADGDGWRKMRDSSLLQGWMVADQLEGNDPGLPQAVIIEAKARLKDEWSKRHPETHIDAAADQLTNHVNITYTDQSPALQATLNAFNTAGVPVDLQRVEDSAGVPGRARRRRHVLRGLAAHRPMDGLRPRQDRRSRDVRAGQRRGRRRPPGSASSRDQGLPESSHADNRPQETSPAPPARSNAPRTLTPRQSSKPPHPCGSIRNPPPMNANRHPDPSPRPREAAT